MILENEIFRVGKVKIERDRVGERKRKVGTV